MAILRCIVVTPEETVRDDKADFVTVTLFDGEIGIAPGHAPFVGRLGAGEMRIREGDRTTRYYVEGGFVEVAGDVVSVLTGRAVPAEKIDDAEAHRQLEAALAKPAHTPELMAQREQAIAQSRAQIRVAMRGE